MPQDNPCVGRRVFSRTIAKTLCLHRIFISRVVGSALIVLSLLAVMLFGAFSGFARPQTAIAQAPNTTLNFQARILNLNGSLVPDGDYHIEFKIYDTVSSGGTAQGACSGNCLWMETRTGGDVIRVVNGYVSANLGSVTSFPSNMPWGNNLYVTMRVGGAGGSPSWDAQEMTNSGNRMKMSVAPVAFVANNVASGSTNSASTNSSTISIQSGNALGTTSNSGNITIDSGTATGTTGAVTIGSTNASAVLLGRAGLTVAIQGGVSVAETAALNGDVTIGNANTDLLTISSTIQGSNALVFEGATADGFETTLAVQDPTADVTLRLPALAAGTYDVCTTSGNCLGTGDIIQGGNSYTTAVTIGTNDVYDLNLETSGVTRVTIDDTTGDVNFTGNLVVAATKSLTLTGGNTASRPASPTEGMIYFDTDTDSLLTYANGKWQSDRGEYIIVASNHGTDPSTQAERDSADYVTDGTADEVEINAALTAASGGKVILLGGTYVAAATILIPNNTTLAGVGAGTNVELGNLDATENLIENTDTTTGTGITIRDLTLDGRNDLNTAGTQYGIYFNTGSSSNIENVYLNRFRNFSIYLQDNSNRNTFDNVKITSGSGDAGIGIDASDYNMVNNINVVGSAGQDNGVEIIGGEYNTVTGSTFSGTFAERAIYMHDGAILNTVSANTINGAAILHAISSETNSGANIITGNTIFGTTGIGIVLNFNSDANTVTNNNITLPGTVGIYAGFSSDNNTIDGNTITYPGGATENDGIVVDGDANQITDNYISDSTCSTACTAIEITANADNTYISGNMFVASSGTAIISNSGTGTTYASQSVAESGLNTVFRQADSTTAFAIQNNAGTSLLNADTSGGIVTITGSASVSGDFTVDTTTLVVNSTTNAVSVGGTLSVTTLGSADTSTFLCRNTSNQLATCSSTPLTNSLTDNVTDAFDLQEGANNYININTTNTTENISFGNATTNPSYSFLGSGALTVNGASTFNSSLTAKGQLLADGTSANQTQLIVRANASQTVANPLVLLQNSSSAELARINATTTSLYFGNAAGGNSAAGVNNTGIGASALGSVLTGTGNTTLGSGALASVSVNDNNTAVGYNAGNLATGGNNIFLGALAGDNVTTGTDNIIIGYNLDASASGATNELRIGGVLQGNTSTLAAQFNGALTAVGLLTGNLGASISGATTNINASSNFGTNINTGTSTGTLAIGNSLSTTTVLGATNINVTGATTTTIGNATSALNINGTTTIAAGLSQTGANTFSTGTGAISLNGATSVTGTNTLTVGTGLTSLGGGLNVTAGNTTLTADLAVNGNTTIGNATTDRLTVTSQILGGTPLVFQGATDNGFTTTLGVTDPTANLTFNLPNVAAGTYDLCTTANNCTALTGYIQNGTALQSSASFNIATGTTTNDTAVIRQMVAQTGALLRVVRSDGTTNVLRVDGATGATLIKSITNGADAFAVQQSGSTNNVLSVDTSESDVSIRASQDNASVGSEMANNTFNTTWTGTGWTLGGSSATHTAGTNTLSPTTPLSINAGTSYVVEFTIASRTAGSLAWSLGGTNGTTIASDVTTFTQVIQTVSTANLIFTPTGTFDGTISAVSVKQLTYLDSSLNFLNLTGTRTMEVRSHAGGTFIGGDAGRSVLSGATGNTAVGSAALQNTTTGYSNNAFGEYALQSNTTGVANTANGYAALRANTTGSNNSAFGNSALIENTIGNYNSAFGYGALDSNTSGSFNVALGNSALGANTTGLLNTAIGFAALDTNTTGTGNIGIGYDVLSAITTSGNNVSIGNESLQSTSGGSNVAIGFQAGRLTTTGASNVFIGDNAGANMTSGDSNIIIGGSVSAVNTTASNQLNIGNTLYGDLANDRIAVGTSTTTAARLTVDNAASTDAILVLQDNGSAVLTVADGGNVTLTADLAVNGDDITSDGATLTINAGGTVAITDNLTVSDLLRAGTGGTPGVATAAGDLYVQDAAEIDGVLNVAGAATFGSTLAVTTLGAADTSTYVCRNSSLQLATCTGSPLTNSLTDNIADAFDLQEGTNNYININTTNSSENISFGNATTNPSYSFLGSGTLSVTGSVSIGAGSSLRVVGGNTASRPGSPTEGMVYFDTDTDSLLTYANGKWQSDRGEYIVVASNHGTDPSTQAERDSADYVTDGTADEVEINAALTAATGGKVILLGGTYVAAATILIPNNTTLTGVGVGTNVELGNLDATDNLIENTDTATGTGITVRDLKLDGRNDLNTAGTQYGIYFNTGSSSNIESIYLTRFRNYGIYLQDSSNRNTLDNVKITSGSGDAGIGIDASDYNTINNINVVGATGLENGVEIIGGESNTVTGSTFSGTFTERAIYMHDGAILNTVSANTINGTLHAISSEVNSGANIITGNTIFGTTGIGIVLNFNSDANTVTGNNITLPGTVGIYAGFTSDNNTIDGNTIVYPGGATENDGIVVDGDANQITDNYISDSTCSTACTAIEITANADNTYISGNVFVASSGTAIISNSGTATTYANQSVAENGLNTVFRQADSTTAFAIQNNAGTSLLNADTTNTNITVSGANSTTTLTNITANSLTTGTALNVSSSSTGLTSGSLISVSSATTGAVATNGIVSLNATGNYTSTSNAALLDVKANSTTAGTVARVQGNALTTGQALYLSSTGTGLTTGSLLYGTSATTGAVATNGVFSLNATGNYTSTSNAALLDVKANSTTAGTVARVQGNALTTGQALYLSSTGTGLTTGSLLYGTSATTGAVATNGIFSLNATGNYTSTSNTGLLNVTANATAAGTITNIQGNALTTGTALNVTSTGTLTTTGNIATFTANSATTATGVVAINATGLTTGSALNVTTGASAIAFNATGRAIVTGTANDAALGSVSSVVGTATSATNGQFGLYSNLTVSPVGASTQAYGALMGYATTSSANLSTGSATISGFNGISQNAGSGNLVNAFGGGVQVLNLSTGTIYNATGLYIANATNSGGGTITRSVGALVANQSVGTTNINLLLGPINAVGISGNWSIYSNSAYDSSLLGNLRVGSNVAPTVALDVTGSGLITQSSNTNTLSVVNDSLTTATGTALTTTGVLTTTGNLLTLTANSATTATGVLTVNATGLTTGAGITVNTGTATALSAGGNITFQEVTGTRVLGVQTRTTDVTGTNLTVQSGQGGTTSAGGLLTLQGGSGGATSGNGGNVMLVGGTATSGTKGLVVVDTATFSAQTVQNFTANANITQASIDSFGSILISGNVAGWIATLTDPSNTTTGRVIYVTNSGSVDMTLAANTVGVALSITLKPASTATMYWNGVDWTAAGASSSTDLQAAYDNTATNAGGAELVLNASGGAADGLTIRNNGTTPIIGGLLEVQSSIGSNLFTVNNNATEFANNGGAESATFTMWTGAFAGGTVTRNSPANSNVATGQGSVSVVTGAVIGHGAENTLTTALTPNLKYAVAYTVKGNTNFSTLETVYSRDGTNTSTVSCNSAQTVTTSQFTRINCTFTAPSSGIIAANSIFIRQTDASIRTFFIDNLSVTVSADVNHGSDGSVDLALGTNWTDFGANTAGTTAAVRNTSVLYDTSGSVEKTTGATADRGIVNNLSINPAVSTQYLVTFYARSSNTFNDIRVRYSRDGGTNFVSCVDYNTQSLSTTAYTRITCIITTDGSAPSNPDLVIDQPTATARTFYVDALTMTLNTNNSNNVQIGGGNRGGPTTLFTLDRAAGNPIAANNDAYLGSMYYDTITGRIQCYEADGWGACGAAPDNIVNLNPEYAGAVLNGSGVGTMTADFCATELVPSTVLSVNTALCAEGEARNYYKWTSPQLTQQTYSVYVTYQLPATFNGFSSDDTIQLTARTDSTTNAAVTYEVFRSTGSAVTACGTETTVVTTANTWQSVGINGNEATGCGFNSSAAGNFVIFKINMKANTNASAYVSTLSFVTTGR